MTGQALAILSTAAWCVGTGALFAVLANWSAGNGSWSVVTGVVRGIRDWSAVPTEELAPLPSSPTVVAASGVRDSPAAEVVELGSRRIS